MGATTVTGTILGVDNSAQVGVYVTFRLKSTGTDSAATSTIDQDAISVITDASGQFSTTLWDNGDSGVTSVLEIRMPSGQRHDVVIPAGDAAIDIWDLIENYTVGTADPQLPSNQAAFLQTANNLSELTATASTARSNIGVAIGSDVQAHSAVLDATSASFLTADETKLDGIEALADVTDATNVAASGAYMVGGTDVAVTDGGTGASDATTARTNLSVPSTSEALLVANNLSDITDPATARANLGVPAAAEGLAAANNLSDVASTATSLTNLGGSPTADILLVANNLSDITDPATARANLGVSSSGDSLLISNNLSDLGNIVTARTNLGLGTAATTASTAYATAAQGTLADAALPKTGGAMTGAITTNSTFDGRDVATDGTKLDGIEAAADVTDATNVVAAGGYIAGGADVAIADGGTGASTEALARTNLEFQTNVTGAVTAVTVTSYTVLTTDHTLTVDDTAIGGNVTINLLAAATAGSGFELTVKKTGSTFDVTLDGSGTETIDGQLTKTLTIEDGSVTIVSNGTNWDVVYGQGTGSADAVVISAVVDEAAGITKGQVIYISGATGGEAQVSIADNTDFSTADIIAVARDTQLDTESITVVTAGLLENIDTSAFTEGDILYLGTSGALTATQPSGINAVQIVGHAVNIDATLGTMLVNLDGLTSISDFNGIMRHQLVNQNAGTSASAAYTIVNDADHRSSVSMVGSNYTAVAGLAESLVIYNEGYNNTVNAVDGNFGFEWWTDVTDSHNLSSTSKMDLTAEGELNTLCQKVTHTATQVDEHALELIVDAAGYGDVKALDIDYITGAIGAGEDEGIILINIDETQSTGGDVYALEVLTTTIGSDAVTAVKTGIGVAPISQDSGIFGDIDTILNKAVDVTAALASGGAGNITIFVADNDTITVGDAGKFAELEVILDTGAGQNVNPTWEYSTGVGTWASFTPTDGTNGFQNTGAMLWNSDDLAGWAVGTGTEYLIRVTRTRNSLSTAPIVDVIQFVDPEVFSWDSTGAVTIDTLRVTSLPAYQDEAAAVTASLPTGTLYQTTGTGAGALYGEVGVVMIKQ